MQRARRFVRASCLGLVVAGCSRAFLADIERLPAPATSVCTNLDFQTTSRVIGAASRPGVQDIPAGVTPDGSSMLVQRGHCSTGLSLFVVDEIPAGSGAYRSSLVAADPSLHTTTEESVTLTSDGLTMIALTADLRGFRVSSRSAVGRADFGAPCGSDFGAIRAAGSQTLWAPSIAADGLAFYYTVFADPDADVNGIYESVRPSTSVPFPPGTRMPEPIQGLAQYVNGVSMDRLSIFLENRAVFQAFVLTRSRVSDPFTNPNAPNPPPVVPGLRTRPLANCDRVVGSCAPQGGCSNEDICTWVAR